jgi:hypothetical protein
MINTIEDGIRELLSELNRVREANARYKAALEELALTDGSEPNVSGIHTLAAHVRSVAHAALKEKKD